MKQGATDTLTFSEPLAVASRATNNAASTGLDISHYKGILAVRVQVGVQTAGDNGSTLQVKLQDSATNSAANAADISTKTTTTGGNNAATYVATISIDPRAQNQFLFARLIITGANSPAWPVGLEVVGQKDIV